MAVKYGKRNVAIMVYIDNKTYGKFKATAKRIFPSTVKYWEAPFGRMIIQNWLDSGMGDPFYLKPNKNKSSRTPAIKARAKVKAATK